jgi:hypothetical protein
MRAFADKNIAFNFATSTSFQQYVSYISRDKFLAPSRWDLVRSMEELLEGEALSHCAKSMSAMIDNEATF